MTSNLKQAVPLTPVEWSTTPEGKTTRDNCFDGRRMQDGENLWAEAYHLYAKGVEEQRHEQRVNDLKVTIVSWINDCTEARKEYMELREASSQREQAWREFARISAQTTQERDAALQRVSESEASLSEMSKEFHSAINEPEYAGTRKDWIDRAYSAEAALERSKK
jgi:hypothetical protein